MASKFDKAKGVQGIKQVAELSNERANLITIKYYKDKDLLDFPKNNEDISDTADIEKSIEEQGFTDPIEITDYGMEEGKFTIVSGHRRRNAGRKRGIEEFPCILRHFNSALEVYNYVLFSNAQRDSSKDPLLFAKRYKMHEEYLKDNGFKGSVREEIASRLGLKQAQADRYNQMNKVILPVWDMVREGLIGMSSVTDSGMYTHSPQEQSEILEIMQGCIENANDLTRPIMKKIVAAYREGKKTWIEVIQTEMSGYINPPKEQVQSGAGVSVMNINTEQTDSSSKEPDRSNEINYDYSHREGLENGTDALADERLTEDDYKAIEKARENEKNKEEKEETPHLSNEENKILIGQKIIKEMSTLEGLLNNIYSFKDKEQAILTLKTMTSLTKVIFAEMERIGEDYSIEDIFDNLIEDVSEDVISYISTI